MLPSQNDPSEFDSEPVQTQGNQTCKASPGLLTKNGFKALGFFKRNAFVVLTMTAAALGTGLGFALRRVNLSARDVKYLTFPGELLMRMLQMLVLPLVVSSLIAGMSSVSREASKKIGVRTLIFYVITTLLAAFTGIALAVLIQPGKSSRTTPAPSGGHAQTVNTVDSFLDLMRNTIPSNLVEACFKKYKTVYSKDGSEPVQGTSDGLNLLGLLLFSLVFGLSLGRLGNEGKLLRDFFESINKAIMYLVSIVIWYSPVGTLFLLAGQIVKMTDPTVIGREVAMYNVTVITGLCIHSFLTLPLIYFMMTRKNPFRFMGGLLEALSTAFGTSSSSATLPVTLHCMEENCNMNKHVTRFMLPLGATMNMDGAALYEAVAALFIAKVNNMDFNLSQMIVLSLIVTAASTGAAGIPQAGMVSMIIVLTSVGLPAEDISLLLIFDWILDRLRTMTNVLGDCIGVGVAASVQTRATGICMLN